MYSKFSQYYRFDTWNDWEAKLAKYKIDYSSRSSGIFTENGNSLSSILPYLKQTVHARACPETAESAVADEAIKWEKNVRCSAYL